MTKHILQQWSEAKTRARESEDAARALVKKYCSTADWLSNRWQEASFTFVDGDSLTKGTGPKVFDLRTETTLQQIRDAVESFHSAERALRTIVNQLTDDDKKNVGIN